MGYKKFMEPCCSEGLIPRSTTQSPALLWRGREGAQPVPSQHSEMALAFQTDHTALPWVALKAANEFVSGLNRQVRKHWVFLLEIPPRPTHEKKSQKGGDGVECGPSAATTEAQKSWNNQHGAAFARDKGPP